MSKKRNKLAAKQRIQQCWGWVTYLLIALSWPLMTTVIQNYSKVKEIQTDFSSLFRKNITNSIILKSYAADHYVHRPELEKLINKSFTTIPNQNYYVVYGNKGSGKTEIVTRAAVGRKGVVKIQVVDVNKQEDVVQLILEELGYDGLKYRIKELVEQMEKVKIDSNIYPTIIFDVESFISQNSQENTLMIIKSVAKSLALVCRCIIVLSEANAVLKFGNEVSRERFIFIGELEIDEAKSYLNKSNYHITDEDFDYVAKNVGTNPDLLVTLMATVPEIETIDKYVEGILTTARQNLVKFPLKTILQALKDPAHVDGVAPKYFKNIKEKGIDLSNELEVGGVMKSFGNPIIFRKDLAKYQMISTAHKTALKTYDPLDPIPIPNAGTNGQT